MASFQVSHASDEGTDEDINQLKRWFPDSGTAYASSHQTLPCKGTVEGGDVADSEVCITCVIREHKVFKEVEASHAR